MRDWARELDTIAGGWRERVASLAGPVASRLLWPSDDRARRWPSLHIDDLGAIPFLDNVVGVEAYQLRARVRARDGDVFVATCPDMPGYEHYCREKLQLGRARFVHAPPTGATIKVAQAARQGPVMDALTRIARTAGGMVVHPYMGNRDVWELADDLAQNARVPVHVLAPAPSVMWLANDKSLMTQLGDELEPLLGRHPCVPTIVADNPAGLSDALRALSAVHPKVALKMTRCASAMGNRVFSARALAELDSEQLDGMVRRFLADKQWSPGAPVLAVAWLGNDVSPSTQTWLTGVGPPRVDGVYEQLLEEEEKVFLGSIPAELDKPVTDWMERVSQLYGEIFQRLGYRGRCSFDFIVSDGTPYLVEVNGRWGGTSTPMHLVDRLFEGGRPCYLARDIVAPRIAGGWTFERLARRLEPLLYDAGERQGRLILYNVGPLEDYGKFDIVALGNNRHEARATVDEALELVGQ